MRRLRTVPQHIGPGTRAASHGKYPFAMRGECPYNTKGVVGPTPPMRDAYSGGGVLRAASSAGQSIVKRGGEAQVTLAAKKGGRIETDSAARLPLPRVFPCRFLPKTNEKVGER